MGLILPTSALLTDLGYSDLSPASQAQVVALIAVATDLIEKRCWRKFAKADYEEKSNGTGQNIAFVANPPINVLNSIFFVDSIDGEETEVLTAHFHFNFKTGEIRWTPYSDSSSKFLGIFPEGFRNILISYNGGFDPIPEGIQYLCASMVLSAYNPSLSPINLESKKLGDFYYKLSYKTMEKSLLQHQSIISLYKLRKTL